jgi:hypothetical protein
MKLPVEVVTTLLPMASRYTFALCKVKTANGKSCIIDFQAVGILPCALKVSLSKACMSEMNGIKGAGMILLSTVYKLYVLLLGKTRRILFQSMTVYGEIGLTHTSMEIILFVVSC